MCFAIEHSPTTSSSKLEECARVRDRTSRPGVRAGMLRTACEPRVETAHSLTKFAVSNERA
jgi:hypothetical protein